MDSIEQIAPCPMCGRTDTLFVEPDERGSGGQWVGPIHVGCCQNEGCGLSLCREDKDEAIAAWNRRTAQDELVSALAGIIDHFGCERGPGHSHVVPGIWDSDNHPYLAGTRCEWCAHWEAARATLSKYRTDATKGKANGG